MQRRDITVIGSVVRVNGTVSSGCNDAGYEHGYEGTDIIACHATSERCDHCGTDLSGPSTRSRVCFGRGVKVTCARRDHLSNHSLATKSIMPTIQSFIQFLKPDLSFQLFSLKHRSIQPTNSSKSFPKERSTHPCNHATHSTHATIQPCNPCNRVPIQIPVPPITTHRALGPQ